MTDQSKPTTDNNWWIVNPFHWGTCGIIYMTHNNDPKSKGKMNGKPFVKIIDDGLSFELATEICKKHNIDLIPAAPTGDKAAALKAMPGIYHPDAKQIGNMKEVHSWAFEYRQTLVAALQENTAPDDLVKALETMIDGYGYCSYISDEEKQEDPDIIFATKILKAYKLRTKGGV